MTTCEVVDCDEQTVARSMCSKHYQRWARVHRDLIRPDLRGVPAIERLLSRCVEIDGCWVYQGPLDHKGYSRLRAEGGRKAFGHRVTWEFFFGPIPAGLTFDHLCRRKACVNPWHGDLVPSLVNSLRSPANIGALNAAKSHCPAGHPLSGDNLRFASNGRGRVCRTCRAESSRSYRLRLKASA